MSEIQDNLLDYECDKVQGEDLIDHSADLEEEPIEEEVIMLEEVQHQPAEPADLGYMLASGDRDIFDEEVTYTVSQLMADLNSPTREDPGVPACFPEVEEAIKQVPIEDWVYESEKGSMDAHMEGQDNRQEDLSLSSQSVEPPLGQGSSRQKFEQWSFQSEPSDQRVQEFVQEAQCRASHQDTLDAISGCSSKPLEVSNHRLGFVRECMLCDGYQNRARFSVEQSL